MPRRAAHLQTPTGLTMQHVISEHFRALRILKTCHVHMRVGRCCRRRVQFSVSCEGRTSVHIGAKGNNERNNDKNNKSNKNNKNDKNTLRMTIILRVIMGDLLWRLHRADAGLTCVTRTNPTRSKIRQLECIIFIFSYPCCSLAST